MARHSRVTRPVTEPSPARREVMHQDQAERGASLVEYALLVALIATASIGAISAIGDESRQKLEGVGEEIATDDPSGEPAGPTGGSGGSGSGGGGSSSGATTTTSSTSAPTSTTEHPVTSPPAPVAVTGQFSDVESWRSGWSWRGSTKLRIRDQHGDAVPDATVRIRISGRDIDAQTVTVTTGSHGTTTLEVGPYALYWQDAVDEVEVTIVGIDAGDELLWDGEGGTVTLHAP